MIASRTAKILHIAGIVLPFIATAHAAMVDSWNWRNPAPYADSMQSIGFGNGRFVAVGAGGIIHFSDDGISWDNGQRPVTTTLNKVIYGGGQFLAVGVGGVILTSSNGLAWTLQSSGTQSNLMGAVYDGTRYVVCGSGGQLAISTNGVVWSLSSAGTGDLGWITFGNGVFVLPGKQVSVLGSPGISVLVSSDLQSWTNCSLPVPGYGSSDRLWQAEFGNGRFVADVADEQFTSDKIYVPSSHFYYSVNGTNWAQGGPANCYYSDYNSILHHRSLFFANGFFYELAIPHETETLTRTADGTASSSLTLPVDMSNAVGGAYGNGRIILVGNGQFNLGGVPGLNGAAGTVWTSIDGTNWTARYSGIQTSIGQIISASNNYVLVSAGQPILVSPDGTSFSAAGNSPTNVLNAIAFDGTNYVAVGGTQIYTSSNSVNWVQRTSNSSQALGAVCRGSSRWVAVGAGGAIVTSPNTLAWTLRSSGTANKLNGVAFGNDLYVAVGNGGTILSSPDGAAWDVQFSGTTTNLNRIRFLNGQFFAVGDIGTILLSSDGSTWSPASAPTSIPPLFDIAYGNGYYIACGNYTIISGPVDPTTVYLLSTNGTTWQDITTKIPTAANPRCIAYLNQSFWIAGDNGLLLQSDSADGVPRLVGSMSPGNGGFQLRIPINVPANYRIQRSTDPGGNSWVDVATNSGAMPTWTDTNAAASPIGFFRIVSP